MPQTFLIGGLWGVLVEQQFAGPKMLLAGKVVEAIGFALYIAPVYGLYLAALGSCSSRSSTSQYESVGGKVFGCSWGYRSCHLPRGCSGQHCFKPVGSIVVACLDYLDLFVSPTGAAFWRFFHSQKLM